MARLPWGHSSSDYSTHACQECPISPPPPTVGAKGKRVGREVHKKYMGKEEQGGGGKIVVGARKQRARSSLPPPGLLRCTEAKKEN